MIPTDYEMLDWVRERFRDSADADGRARKLAEEAGEVVGAVNRILEGRGSVNHLATEMAQLLLVMKSLAALYDIDTDAAMAREWADIQDRVWT